MALRAPGELAISAPNNGSGRFRRCRPTLHARNLRHLARPTRATPASRVPTLPRSAIGRAAAPVPRRLSRGSRLLRPDTFAPKLARGRLSRAERDLLRCSASPARDLDLGRADTTPSHVWIATSRRIAANGTARSATGLPPISTGSEYPAPNRRRAYRAIAAIA